MLAHIKTHGSVSCGLRKWVTLKRSEHIDRLSSVLYVVDVGRPHFKLKTIPSTIPKIQAIKNFQNNFFDTFFLYYFLFTHFAKITIAHVCVLQCG